MLRYPRMSAPGPLRALIVTVLLLLAVGCSTNQEPASDPLAADDFGVTPEDVLAGVQAREEHVQRCMDAQGYEYQLRDPAEQVQFDGDRPGWGSAYDLLELARQSQAEPMNEATEAERSRPAGYDDALHACSDEAWNHQREREHSIATAVERLERAWQEFRASSEYTEAAREWSACMASHGYDIVWPEEVRDDYNQRLMQVVNDAGGPEHVEESAARGLLDEEVALRGTYDECRSTTLTPIEQEFRRNLFTEEAEAVGRIRDAWRG